MRRMWTACWLAHYNVRIVAGDTSRVCRVLAPPPGKQGIRPDPVQRAGLPISLAAFPPPQIKMFFALAPVAHVGHISGPMSVWVTHQWPDV
jgi:hypothetical protein